MLFRIYLIAGIFLALFGTFGFCYELSQIFQGNPDQPFFRLFFAACLALGGALAISAARKKCVIRMKYIIGGFLLWAALSSSLSKVDDQRIEIHVVWLVLYAGVIATGAIFLQRILSKRIDEHAQTDVRESAREMSKIKHPFRVLSAVLFILACFLPAYVGTTREYSLPGFNCLLTGWISILYDGDMFLAWLANIPYAIAILLIFNGKYPRAGLYFIGMALVFGHFAIYPDEILKNEAGAKVAIQPGIGMFVWLASFALVGADHLQQVFRLRTGAPS